VDFRSGSSSSRREVDVEGSKLTPKMSVMEADCRRMQYPATTQDELLPRDVRLHLSRILQVESNQRKSLPIKANLVDADMLAATPPSPALYPNFSWGLAVFSE
jgi:hypothetical protein